MDAYAGEARTVLVVDDREVVRARMRTLLDEDRGLELVGEAADGESGVALAAELRPDIVVMDLKMPGMSGIKATWELGSRIPECSVVVLTVSEDPRTWPTRSWPARPATSSRVPAATRSERPSTASRRDKGSSAAGRERPGRAQPPTRFERRPPRPAARAHHALRGDPRDRPPFPLRPNLAIAVVAGALFTAIGLADEIRSCC